MGCPPLHERPSLEEACIGGYRGLTKAPARLEFTSQKLQFRAAAPSRSTPMPL